MLLQLEITLEFAIKQQKLVEGANVRVRQLKRERLVVGLLREVLVEFLAAEVEEAAELFNVRPRLEELLVLELGAVLGVVAHQELAEEDARVEAFANRAVD